MTEQIEGTTPKEDWKARAKAAEKIVTDLARVLGCRPEVLAMTAAICDLSRDAAEDFRQGFRAAGGTDAESLARAEQYAKGLNASVADKVASDKRRFAIEDDGVTFVLPNHDELGVYVSEKGLRVSALRGTLVTLPSSENAITVSTSRAHVALENHLEAEFLRRKEAATGSVARGSTSAVADEVQRCDQLKDHRARMAEGHGLMAYQAAT